MKTTLRPTVVMIVGLSVITGLAYPALMTGVAQGAFRDKANGSLVVAGGREVGSRLVGQAWDHPRYLWGRPSGTVPAYNAAASSGTNFGPLNPALADQVKARVEELHKADPGNVAPIPIDLVTASGSGLDPHVSPAAAEYQAERIAGARGLAIARVREVIAAHTEERTWGILGEPRVNVLEVNLALDALR